MFSVHYHYRFAFSKYAMYLYVNVSRFAGTLQEKCAFLTAIERSYRGPTSGKCENRHMDLSRTKLFVTDTS